MKINNSSVRPLAGFAFVRMQGIYDANSGLIAIPDKYKAKRHGFGELVDISPTEENDRSIASSYSDMVGSRIIFDDYAKAPVGDGVFRIPIADCIIAVITDSDVKIEAVSPFQGVERCQHCGPAKAGSPNSMILDYDGYCPRCGKNASGDKKDNFSEESLAPFMRK